MPTPTLPSAEQTDRARWDLLLLDIEARTEQVRQMKRYEPWRMACTGLTAGAAIAGAFTAFGALLATLVLK